MYCFRYAVCRFGIELKIWHGDEYNCRGEEQLCGYLEEFRKFAVMERKSLKLWCEESGIAFGCVRAVPPVSSCTSNNFSLGWIWHFADAVQLYVFLPASPF